MVVPPLSIYGCLRGDSRPSALGRELPHSSMPIAVDEGSGKGMVNVELIVEHQSNSAFCGGKMTAREMELPLHRQLSGICQSAALDGSPRQFKLAPILHASVVWEK